MAELIADYLPIMIAIIAVVVAPALAYFSRQSTSAISGTIKLETYTRNLDKLVEDHQEIFNKLSEKLDQFIRKQDNHEWRLESMERELVTIKDKKIGVLETELAELRNHKARVAYLEREIKDLKYGIDERDRRKHGGERSPT